MKDVDRGLTLSEDNVFRLRGRMKDHSYDILDEGGTTYLAFRMPGEEIDLLRSLEFLSEFLSKEDLDRVDRVVIISDRNQQETPSDIIAPKLAEKTKEDERLYSELKTKLKKRLEPLVFTEENDILELYRIAIRVDGSIKKEDEDIALDLMRITLPKEGDVIYLIFRDGFKKMSRSQYMGDIDRAMTNIRSGPELVKDPPSKGMTLDSYIKAPGAAKRAEISKDKSKTPSRDPRTTRDIDRDPKVMMREFAKRISGFGYREDARFSRPDANQMFFISMSGPAVFYKILGPEEDITGFLRVLGHRSDAFGVLVSEVWDPKLEAISRIRGFIYLDKNRAMRAHEVLREVVGGGA